MMKIETWNIEELTGYIPKTTFYEDFSIADHYGVAGIKDTFERAFSSWKTNYIFLTELVMVLNWKIWVWYKRNEAVARVYNDLWKEARDYAEKHLKGDELAYYYRTTN